MWYVAKFNSTSLFSLRPYNATTSGGKTLITPTPYAVKMAMLDVAIRIYGLERGKLWFPRLRDLKIAINLPPLIIVNNTFIKILRPHKSGPRDIFGTGLVGPMGNTIAYRELVHFGGPLWIAIKDNLNSKDDIPIDLLLAQIHYLGKRGGFMQFEYGKQMEDVNASYTYLNPDPSETFKVNGVLQMLDDCGPRMTFFHADIYSGKSLAINKPTGRVAQPVILPFQPVRSSNSFTLYKRIDNF